MIYVVIAWFARKQYRETQRTRQQQSRDAEESRLAQAREAEQNRLAQARNADADRLAQIKAADQSRLALEEEAEKNRHAQAREAAKRQLAESRPFVIVDAHFRSIITMLKVENIGKTAATKVRVQLDAKVEAAYGSISEHSWQDGQLFTTGVPLMAPGREMLFLLDRFPDRMESDLPMKVAGTVFYQSHDGGESFAETFNVDLGVFIGALLPDKGLPDLVKGVEKLGKLAQKAEDRERDRELRVRESRDDEGSESF